jgi:hypothetical protein
VRQRGLAPFLYEPRGTTIYNIFTATAFCKEKSLGQPKKNGDFTQRGVNLSQNYVKNFCVFEPTKF